MQKVAVLLLYGRSVKNDDLLKISQTSLEGIIEKEEQDEAAMTAIESSSSSNGRVKRAREIVESSLVNEADADGEDNRDEVELPASKSSKRVVDANDELGMSPIPLTRSFSLGSSNNRQFKSSKLVRLRSPMSAVNQSPATTMAPPADVAEWIASMNGKLIPESSSELQESSPSTSIKTAGVIQVDDSESTIKPYDKNSQLEYLEDGFQLISLMIKGNTAKMKDELKKEGTSHGYRWYDASGEQKHSNRELKAKIKLQEKRINTRLRKTTESGIALPRLEVLTKQFGLDSFEKRLILLLIGATVSPIVRTLLDNMEGGAQGDTTISVGQVLSILCQDFNSQIAHRKYFYQSSRLMANGVISLFKGRWYIGTGDLTENRLNLDRRILDWVVGLDSEINELVEGSDLYEPMVQLSQVVLPHGHMERILSQCYAYDDYLAYQRQSTKENKLSYGNSLVILLCGKPGTGKSMTVNAVAKELGKKVLLVDFHSLLNKKDGTNGGLEVDLKGLFREGKMSNAVLFFDECETIFMSRNVGGDRVLNSLLTEIERHEGIVFLATNRPHEIDEAMHRRITMVIEYREPDPHMRKQIWDNLLKGLVSSIPTQASSQMKQSNGTGYDSATEEDGKDDTLSATPSNEEVKSKYSLKKLTLADNVETSMLASKYRLTGGFIKNAVLSSILIALARDKVSPEIRQEDLIEGCKMQMRGNLTHAFNEKFSSNRRLDDLYLPDTDKSTLRRIIGYEKSREKIYGTWTVAAGDDGNQCMGGNSSQHASINLIAGNRGSGKGTIVGTVAYELGEKRIKYIHFADVLGHNVLDATELFSRLTRDAAIIDAVIVIDGFEHILSDPGDHGSEPVTKLNWMLSRVMDILYEFHGCIFLLAHLENPQNIDLKRFESRPNKFVLLVNSHELS